MRRRTNVPLEVVDEPNITTDPIRAAEIQAEFTRRLWYIPRSYFAARATFKTGNAFNEELARLQAEIARGELTKDELTKEWPKQADLHFAVLYLAKQASERRGHAGPLSADDVIAGKHEAVMRLHARKSRPSDRILRMHVEALVAAVQEVGGRPVRVSKKRDHDYAPQAMDKMSKFVVDFFPDIDPTVSRTTVVNMILDAQKKYAGRSMRFPAILPGYGVKVTPF